MTDLKVLKTPKYNYVFNRKTGYFARWGETLEDDPEYCFCGPEILDIEISTICHRGCSFCYKANTSVGENMSFETFKKIFDKFPKCLTQIALGIGDVDANEDLWKIMKYCRENDVVPNITINGYRMKDEYYKKLADLCGAVAVSSYNDNVCFEAVRKLGQYGLKQVNIHKLLSVETYDSCFKLIDDTKDLKELNCVVFLFLKPKGSRNIFHPIKSLEKYKKLVDYAFAQERSIGFDSCSAPSFLKAISDRNDYLKLEQMVEPCESTLFSGYINVDGEFYPCSFAEGENDYKGINVLEVKNFLRDVWNTEETKSFRDKLIKNKNCMNCRECQIFDLGVN